MTIGKKIKQGTPLAIVMSLALVFIPLGAQAKQQPADDGVQICHLKKKSQGDLVVDESDPQAEATYTEGLAPFKGANANAARHSPVISFCSEKSGGGSIGGSTT